MTTSQTNLQLYLLQLITMHNNLSNNNEAYNDELFDVIYILLRQLNYTTYNQDYFWEEYEMFKDEDSGLMEFLSLFIPYDDNTFSKAYELSSPTDKNKILGCLFNAHNNQFPKINTDENGYEQIIDKNKVLENFLNSGVIHKIDLNTFSILAPEVNRPASYVH